MTTLQDRFRTFMEEKGLSPLQLAEELQVQRSSISHILNGRNKPSLDFLKKLISVYPEIDLHHLISGESQPAQADLFSEAPAMPAAASVSEPIPIDTNVNTSKIVADTNVNKTNENEVEEQNTLVNPRDESRVTSVSTREDESLPKETNGGTPSETAAKRKLVKVVLLYADGSFEEYSS